MSIFDVSSMDSLKGSVNADSNRTVPWCHNRTIVGLRNKRDREFGLAYGWMDREAPVISTLGLDGSSKSLSVHMSALLY